MSLQTNVFENGRWVTRNIDPYQARARNTEPQRKGQTASSTFVLTDVPSIGLLTRTVVRSPVIKWIIPAKIRHETKNDVLFITAASVQIKEISEDYALKTIAIKDDFDAPIRAARALGDPRELAHVNQSANRKSERDGEGASDNCWEYQNNGSRPGPPHSIPVYSPHISPHIAVLALESNKLVFLCAVSGTSDDPQFLCCQKELPASPSPLEKLGEHIAVDPKSVLLDLRATLSDKARSRAIAVAAQEGIVYVYMLHSMDNMRTVLVEESKFNPIKEVSMPMCMRRRLSSANTFDVKERRLPDVPAGCSILKMEFLHPSENDHEQIILLLIISRNGKTRMLWYEWNCRMSLRGSQLKPSVQSVPQDERLPLLLIPLQHLTAFIVVYEKQIALYKDLLTGTPHRYIERLEEVKDPEGIGTFGRLPVWVQWARPMRKTTDKFTVDHDGIFLCREDGVVQYLSLLNGEHVLDSKQKAGRLGFNVNTAFAVLDVAPNKADVFAAGGDMSEGGLWRTDLCNDPLYLTPISNWTPLNEVATVGIPVGSLERPDWVSAADRAKQEKPQMWACTGRGKHGAITELRYGYAAPKRVRTHDLSDEVNRDVLKVWAFHGSFGHIEKQYEFKERLKNQTYVLITCPMRTFLLRVPLEGRPGVVSLDLGLEYNARTIAASSTTRGLIQVTENSIRVTSLQILQFYKGEEAGWEHEYNQNQELEVKTEDQEGAEADHENDQATLSFCYKFQDLRVLSACIYATSETTLILLAGQQGESFHLQLGILNAEYVPLKTITLQSQASALLLRDFEDHILALVSNVEGELQMILTDVLGSRLELISKYKFQGSYAICDSLAITTVTNEEEEKPKLVVACGLRNGSLDLLCLGASPSYSLSLLEEHVVGNTSVTVLSDSKRATRTIVHCEEIICALEYHGGMRSSASFHRILMTDREDPESQNGMLSAFTQAVDGWLPDSVPGCTAGLLFCIDGNLLHTISLDRTVSAGMVPRHLPIGGTPVRVIYSTHLQKLIILYNKLPMTSRGSTQTRRDRNASHKRDLVPRIMFRDPNSEATPRLGPDEMEVESDLQLNENANNDETMDAERKPSERFIGITEWFPFLDGRSYHLLLVHTILARAGKQVGRLLFFTVSQSNLKIPNLNIKKRLEVGGPVYSVAVHPDGKSLVYCSGSELCIQGLESGPVGIRWQSLVKMDMRSPARHITIAEPLIYVSSIRESLTVYRYEAGKLVYQYGDQCAREGLHHMHVPEHSLLLASDMTNTVVGLYQPPERRIDNAMSTVFEATLPSSITRLKRIAKPSWARDVSPEANNELIVGFSADGTITNFDIVTKGFRVFKFIQNMAERNPITCPFAGIMPHKRQLEPKTDRPHRMHVNGDILKRVLERGGQECIRDMLNVEVDLEMHTDFDSVEDRWARFKELAGEVVDIGDDGWLGSLVEVIERNLRGAF